MQQRGEKNSELRKPQDSLLPAAVVVDENGLTFAARRGSQRGAGRSRRGPLGILLELLEGTLRHGCHACGKGKEKIAGQISRHRTIRRVAGGPKEQRRRSRALIGRAPPALGASVSQLIATPLGKEVARLLPFGEYNKKWPVNQAIVTATAPAPSRNLVATAPLLRDPLASPSPRGSCFLKYFWAVAVSLVICSDIPRSRHHRIRKAKLGMPSVAKMGPSTADTGEMRPATPPGIHKRAGPCMCFTG